MAESYDEQQEREWLESASRITEKQLRTAIELTSRVFADNASAASGAVPAVVQALAINLSTIRRKR